MQQFFSTSQQKWTHWLNKTRLSDQSNEDKPKDFDHPMTPENMKQTNPSSSFQKEDVSNGQSDLSIGLYRKQDFDLDIQPESNYHGGVGDLRSSTSDEDSVKEVMEDKVEKTPQFIDKIKEFFVCCGCRDEESKTTDGNPFLESQDPTEHSKRSRKWEEFEDFILVECLTRQLPTMFHNNLVQQFQDNKLRFQWKKVFLEVPRRTEEQCQYRFNRLKNRKSVKLIKILKAIQESKLLTFSEEEDIQLGIFAEQCLTAPQFKRIKTNKKESSLKYRYFIHHLKYSLLNGVFLNEDINQNGSAQRLIEMYQDLSEGSGSELTPSQIETRKILLEKLKAHEKSLTGELKEVKQKLVDMTEEC